MAPLGQSRTTSVVVFPDLRSRSGGESSHRCCYSWAGLFFTGMRLGKLRLEGFFAPRRRGWDRLFRLELVPAKAVPLAMVDALPEAGPPPWDRLDVYSGSVRDRWGIFKKTNGKVWQTAFVHKTGPFSGGRWPTLKATTRHRPMGGNAVPKSGASAG